MVNSAARTPVPIEETFYIKRSLEAFRWSWRCGGGRVETSL